MKRLKPKFDGLISVVLIKSPTDLSLTKYISSLVAFLQKRFDNYEIVLVDNGIYPIKTLQQISKKHIGIRILRLSKMFSIDQAYLIGVDNAIGDYVVTLDPYIDGLVYVDEIIVQLQQAESDLVVGLLPKKYSRALLSSIGSKVFHWYIRNSLKMKIHNNSTFAMGMTRRMVNLISRTNSYYRNMRFLAYHSGLKVDSLVVSYSQPLQKPDQMQLITQALDIISHYSNHPLRLVSLLGLMATLANLIYVIYIVFIYVTKSNVVEGWTTTSLQISVLFFFTFFILTIFSEYIGRIFDEIRQGPRYFIVEEIKSDVLVNDELRRNVIIK